MFSKNKLLRLSAIVAICTAPAMSFFHRQWPQMTQLQVDFSASGTDLFYNTWTPPGGTAGTKYFFLDLNGKGGGVGQCYEIWIDGDPTDDVRLWTAGNVSIDDDGPGGDRKPTAKMWITSAYQMRVSAFSTAYNSIGYVVTSSFTTATSAATCDDGFKPFYNQVTNTVLRADTIAN